MKKLICASFAAFLLAGNAFALNTYDSRSYTCDQMKSIIQQEGQAIVTSGFLSSMRLVSDVRFCRYNEQLNTALVTTADKTFCWAGDVCVKQHNHRNR
jgi:hypothetical protein